MTKYTLTTLALALLGAMPASADIIRHRQVAAPSEAFAGVSRLAIPAPSRSGSLVADFSISGGDALAPVSVMDFNNPASHGWTLQADNDVEWSVKKTSGAKDFSSIDPDDGGSLQVSGPYQTFKRAISTATSPDIVVPSMATLTFYVGFSLNYEDTNSLTLSVVDGDNVTALWCSADQKGDKPWAWRQVSVSLSAFAGKTVKLRFTYGPGTADMFQTGGYMGEYLIDNIAISAPQVVEHIDVATGERISLLDLSEGAVEWSWIMPGAVPSTSTEQSPEIYYTADGTYDITLTVTDAEGNKASKTRTSFATVTGTAPVARIIPAATFRNSGNRLPLVAPQVPVTFMDGSTGFPTKRAWVFTGVDNDPEKPYVTDEENPEVAYAYLHEQTVGLEVENEHGSSADVCEVSVEYSAVVTNMRPDDKATVRNMDDWGVFPGTNTRNITAYAEKFSKPSRPVMIDGAYVFFNRAEAKHIADQIANVCVRLCRSENGVPGEELDFMCWSVFELDTPTGGQMVGTAFPFTEAPVVDDEFFLVVDGLPEYNDSCCVSFTMAAPRSEGNTAYMKKDDKWIAVPEYFGADSHTSFMIYPSVHHSVMNVLSELKDGKIEVGPDASSVDVEIFSYMGYQTPVEISDGWLRMTSTPNDMTVDTLTFAFDSLPAGVTEREATVTLTDGASSISFIVRQSGVSRLETLTGSTQPGPDEIYDLLGRRLTAPTRGVNIINGKAVIN